MNVSVLSENIQLAVAPVFLLTAVANLIGALTQRLARVIDRSRKLQDELMDEERKISPGLQRAHEEELINVARRGRLINIAMIILVIGAIQIGLTVLELFFGKTYEGKVIISNFALATFSGGIGSFVLSLICLLGEVLIASYSIRWKPHK